MGRERAYIPRGSTHTFRDRHRKAGRHVFSDDKPMHPSLVAKPAVPLIKSKHKTIFEFVDNEKKKKLEFQVTPSKVPPPGYDYVPIGNPELTKLCKELSREQDALIFIVSPPNDWSGTNLNLQLSLHLNRIGHHIRQTIIEEAQRQLGNSHTIIPAVRDDLPEPIPKRQAEINAQADAAIRDLFPRIPHTDRQMIIDRAFRKGLLFQGNQLVGLAGGISLSRRVQLAVLAHIRHNHTTYDELLRKTSRNNARKVVEPLCLDILVKWRGDEENGRDDLDVILKEVVVISDDEDEDEDEDVGQSSDPDHAQDGDQEESSAEELSASTDALPVIPGLDSLAPRRQEPQEDPAVVVTSPLQEPQNGSISAAKSAVKGASKRNKKNAKSKKRQKGFVRYEAAWKEARRRAHPESSSVAQDLDAFGDVGHLPVDPALPSPARPSPREMPSAFRTQLAGHAHESPVRLQAWLPHEWRQDWHPVPDPGGPSSRLPGPDPPVVVRMPPPPHITARDGFQPPPSHVLFPMPRSPWDQPLPSVEAPSPNLRRIGVPHQQPPVHNGPRIANEREPLTSSVFVLPSHPPPPPQAIHALVYPAREPVAVTASPRAFAHSGLEPRIPNSVGYYVPLSPRVVVTRDPPNAPPPMLHPRNGESNGYPGRPLAPAPVPAPAPDYGYGNKADCYGFGDRDRPVMITDSPRAPRAPLPPAPLSPPMPEARSGHVPPGPGHYDGYTAPHRQAPSQPDSILVSRRDPNPFPSREPWPVAPTMVRENDHPYAVVESGSRNYWPATTSGGISNRPPMAHPPEWDRSRPHVPIPPSFASNLRGPPAERRPHDADLESHGVIILD